jgi:zinc-ribbon domain
LPYCSECGKEVPAGVKFCPNCGTALLAAGSHPQKVEAKPATLRPGAVTLGVLLDFVVGGIFLVLGVIYLFLPEPAGLLAFAVTLGAVMLAVGGASVFSGYGLWKRRRWVWKVGTGGGIGYVVVGAIVASPMDSWVSVVGVLAALLGAFTLYYLWLGGARAYFTG